MTEPSLAIPYDIIRDLTVTATGFVFDPRSGRSFSVNETGLVAMRAFLEGLDLFETKVRLIAKFSASSDVVDAGLNSFVRQLNRHLA
ncbi:MAG: hypothetical protein WCH83_01495 [Alphaproteobacteria bacterium]|jgi:hypothetical protein